MKTITMTTLIMLSIIPFAYATNIATLSPSLEGPYQIVRISGNESCWADISQSGIANSIINFNIRSGSDRICEFCDNLGRCNKFIVSPPTVLNVYDEKGSLLTSILGKASTFNFNFLNTASLRKAIRFLRFGEQSIVISASNTYNATTTNITQHNKFANLLVSTEAPYNSLIGYWNFDTDILSTSGLTAYDLSNNSLDGTYTDDAISQNTCGVNTPSGSIFMGCSYYYNNTLPSISQGINLGTSKTLLYLGAGNFTISAWVKKGGGSEGIIKRGSAGSTAVNVQQYMIQSQAKGQVRFTMGNGTASVSVISSENTTSSRNWSLVTVTVNQSNALNIYINGLLNGTVQRNITGVYSADNSTYLATSGATGGALNGQLDEVMVFNTSLNSSQVMDIYNNKSSRFNPNGQMLFQDLNLLGNTTVNIKLNNSLIAHYLSLLNNFQLTLNTTLDNSYLSMYMNNGSEVNFTNGLVSNYPVQNNLTDANLTLIFHAGDNVTFNPFYTPYLFGNITIDSFLFISSSAGVRIFPNKPLTVPYMSLNNPLEFQGVPYMRVGTKQVFA